MKNRGYDEPEIVELFEPERIKLQLKFTKIGDKKSAVKIGDKIGDKIKRQEKMNTLQTIQQNIM